MNLSCRARACPTPSPGAAHCPTCHHTFGSVTAFDAHRIVIGSRNSRPRPTGPLKQCADPVDVGLAPSGTGRGVWVRPMSEAARERLAGLR